MPRITEQAKESQMELVFLRVKQSPHGITEREIANATGIQRKTVNNYLHALADEGKVRKEGRLWFLEKYEEIRNLKFEITPEEAYTYYLGSRLFVKQHDKRNKLAETALMKLADALAANRLVGHEIAQAARELAQRPGDATYETIFQTMVRGYLQRKRVAITYKPLNGSEFDTTFETYLMEPSAIGYATYVIGYSSLPDARRSYKLERIIKADLLQDEYRIPNDFPGLEILRNSWSIIMGEDLVKVELRFSPRVKERVRETQWHPSQGDDHDATKTKDDWLTWWVYVADTMDMLPWIRSWGADVEVVGPEWLREELIKATRKQAKLYGIQLTPIDSSLSRLLSCWGKTSKIDDSFHPALYHIMDVAHVAHTLLSTASPRRWRRILALALNVTEDSLINWLPYAIALHDIGKISASFQMRNQTQVERLLKEGFQFGDWPTGSDIYHAMISQSWIESLFSQTNPPLGRVLRETYGEMLGGHHGRWAHRQKIGETTQLLNEYEPLEWSLLRSQADTLLRSKFLQGTLNELPQPANISTAVMALTGFTILCDWLGSDSRFFQPDMDTDFETYVAKSKKQAVLALGERGFLEATSSNAPTDAGNLFADLGNPRPLQVAIDNIPNELLEKPVLAIIEAPTGEGKTEAAFALAHRIACRTGTDEFYCALPTMATSNQMFKRLSFHLHKRLHLSQQVKLVHGQAYLVEDELRSVAQMQFLDNGEELDSLERLTWFNSSKKGLIAPFGVGTIDQVELAALNVKHLALRMMSLAGKVVIIDEVHAYDTYMTKILEQVLRWLKALNTSVILLSATLPKAKRKRLAEAYGVKEDNGEVSTDAYPSLLLCYDQSVWHQQPKAWQTNRIIQWHPLHYGDKQAAEKANWLLDSIREGGCACWVTNTVRRAQRIFKQLRANKPADVSVFLLHSQFPLEQRKKLEDQLDELFGSKSNNRPHKAIVIGTQVLEQSLDLDFDVMVSDLAPIDLLLQRAGRLHRHPLADRPRYNHQVPHLWVNFEQTESEDLKIGTDRSVYHPYFQRKTLFTLRNTSEFNLPFDYRPLIEAVYDEVPPNAGTPLWNDWRDLYDKEINATNRADECLITNPSPRSSFSIDTTNKVKFEEDENKAAWIVAQTRLGKESVNVIPLYVEGNAAHTKPDSEPIPLDFEAPQAIQMEMLRRNLRISYTHLVKAIKQPSNHKNTKLFSESKLLKGFYPLWIDNNRINLTTGKDTFVLQLDPELGIIPVDTEEEHEE